MNVFNIPIEGESFLRGDDACVNSTLAERIANAHGPFWIVTANPEILLEAKRDKAYAEVLKQADARIVDGFGLWLMLKLAGQQTVRLTGVELANNLLQLAVKQQWRVALIGGREGVAEQAAAELKRTHPTLQIATEYGGEVSRNDGVNYVRPRVIDAMENSAGEEARHRLTLFAPQLLLVAFGHPKQERWIARYLADFPSVKVAVGIGGTVDFWAGTAKRAPKLFQRLGIEWLWRLITQPKRIGRILNAVVVFPVAFFIDRLRKQTASR
jgi:N-acetylglucosaminyldiphosphoundecaprenol N-acetyl-beta-D-mannosaminyltransferase